MARHRGGLEAFAELRLGDYADAAVPLHSARPNKAALRSVHVSFGAELSFNVFWLLMPKMPIDEPEIWMKRLKWDQ